MHIAVFLPNWIGDVVMATPAIRALATTYPHARLTAVGRPYVADVLSGAPWFDEFIACDPKGPSGQGGFAVAARLRRARPDLAILFPNSFRVAWIAWLAGCRRRVGYARYGRAWLLTDRLQPVRDGNGRIKPSPILLAYNRLALAAGCTNVTSRLELFVTPTDDEHAARIWHETGLENMATVYCLNPGAAFGAAKLWPTTYFADLARALASRPHSGVLVLCGPNERERARHIVAAAKHPGVHSLADANLSLGLTKACVRRADVLVSTDSGPRHFAAAFDRPVVSLFGPTHIAWTDTFHLQEIQLQKQVPCGPCQLRECPLDHRCMTQLVPEEVLAGVDALRLRKPLFPDLGACRAG